MRRWNIDGGAPRAGQHYPRNLREFGAWFSSEDAAAAYLAAVRFRNGLVCPRCHEHVPERRGERWWCNRCRRWFSVTTGTLLERTRVPLDMWLFVAWQVVQTKIGVSALSVQRMAGIDYRSAWALLHKMRVAMDQEGRERLTGDVEFDETYVGGREEGASGRSRQNKEPVAVACEHRSDRVVGRIRLARLPDASALAIADFLEHNVEPGSVLLSDDWTSYEAAFEELAGRGLHYGRKVTTLSRTTAKAHVIHPHVHRVASLLKRWLLGTHQGSVAGRYLDAYLDEFVFRFNRRHSSNRGLVFWRLVCALLETRPVTRDQLVRRRTDQQAADTAHAKQLKEWRHEREHAKDRERYRSKVEAAGGTVHPYRPKGKPRADSSS